MSKTERRYRRAAQSMGATETADGRIQPPSYSQNPGYYWFFGALLVLCFIMAIVSGLNGGK